MDRKEIFEKKLKEAAKLTKGEKQMVKSFDDCELCNHLYEVKVYQTMYVQYVQNICQYLLDSCNTELNVPDELKEEADLIENHILKDLNDIRAYFLMTYSNSKSDNL